jgi:hypothetical protein
MDTNWKWIVGGIVMAALSLVPVLPGQAQDKDMPASIQIDSLSRLYGPVAFDHAMHADMAGGCAVCHHRGPGELAQNERCNTCHPNAATQSVEACQGCHSPTPFAAADIRRRDSEIHRHHRDVLGLKGAYHLGCMGCHQKMGGPTGCQDCHSLTDAGKAFYNEGKYAPQAATAEKKHH